MSVIELQLEGGEASLVVHRFSVREAISTLFEATILARSESPAIDLEGIVGKRASLKAEVGYRFAVAGTRVWSGVVRSMELVHAVSHAAYASALSTYQISLVPSLWLLGQRRNYRVFQHLAIPDIVKAMLDEWSIEHTFAIDAERYPKLEYRVQYGESDLAFVLRLLEEAGIAFTFPDDGSGGKLVFGDALESGDPRSPDLHFVDEPNEASEKEFATAVRLSQTVKPGAYTIRDYDPRNPAFPLFSEAPPAAAPEAKYEQFEYAPGSFLVEGGRGGNTPVADDKGVARHDKAFGDALATRRLDAERVDKRVVGLESNVMDLYPGRVFSIEGHPHAAIEGARLLVRDALIEGSRQGEWGMSASAVYTDVPYRPLRVTPKPRAEGVQCATVVGPSGQEIHTDELGRVRVQFPWDRRGKLDDDSSCWIRVSQGWAGTGYGMVVLPRVGQEVLVGFLEGDPDHPIVVGRVFNATQGSPYKLPDHKTRSALRSDSSPGSGGSNEILLEDAKGQELMYVQAQKNMRQLVKNDETITVGGNRQRLVVGNELTTAGGDRVEVTGGARTEITRGNHASITGGAAARFVGGDAQERTAGSVKVLVGGDQDLVIKAVRRDRVEGDAHLVVGGSRAEKVVGAASTIVGGDRHDAVSGSYAIGAGDEIHLKSGGALVIEAPELTLQGAGGFVKIDAGGVTIQGTLVKINSGGSPGAGRGVSAIEPAVAAEPEIEEPTAPEPDNVAHSGLAQ